MVLEEAKDFVRANVLTPGLASADLGTSTLRGLKDTVHWINHMPAIGDLHRFLSQTTKNLDNSVYQDLNQNGLLAFEDIIKEFEYKFQSKLNDYFKVDDLEIGMEVSSRLVNILGQSYRTQSGGILLNRQTNGELSHVILRCNLAGGNYSNQWLDEAIRLKYFMKAINGIFKESYIENAAIINNPGIPIFAFTRLDDAPMFRFAGQFSLDKIHTQEENEKWFELVRSNASGCKLNSPEDILDLQRQAIIISASKSKQQRVSQINFADKNPVKVPILSYAFIRNADVIVQTLEDAAGICEGCKEEAPFIRRKDKTPYLEVHHKIPLSEGGKDTLENAVALCANCHRREHFGPARWIYNDRK